MIDISINRAPRLGLFSFDAVLETTTQGSVKLTNIPLESGAEVNDHRIRNPNTYVMRGAVSNSPLKQNIDDILSLGLGVISNVTQSGATNTALNLGSSYLAGSDGVRSATSASLLFTLKDSGDTITILTGLMVLKDMVIKDVQLLQDPDTDNGFIFVAQLQEFMYVKSIGSETSVGDMDPGMQTKSSPTSFLGELGLEQVTNQGWAQDAFNQINSWTGGLLD
ncbi:tail fiber protein [Vibrio phage D81]